MEGVSFDLPTVTRSKRPMHALNRELALRGLVGDLYLNQHYESDAALVACTDVHLFAQAACDAFYRHFPLVITPDIIWFCIAQGVAQHINLNAEHLRKHFVTHQDKLILVVNRPDFSLRKRNPWPEAFAAFSSQIAEHIGPVHKWLMADFSTTGPVERAASEIVLMDAFQAYFEYEMMIGCGIPNITLLGTVGDWESVRSRAERFSQFGLDWWLKPLLSVLDALVNTASGRQELDFWKSFFRYEGGSGPPELTGWMNVLFPYLKDYEGKVALMRNPYLDQWREAWQVANQRPRTLTIGDVPEGPALGSIPSGLNRAPVRIVDELLGVTVDAQFIGGLFGVVQDPTTLALIPEFGWAIAHPPIASLNPRDVEERNLDIPRLPLHIVV